jgi:predicted nucleotidyltransferase
MTTSSPINVIKSLFTGSQVYGTPRPDSDVDIVILTDQEGYNTLMLKCDGLGSPMEYGASLRFGNLNLIVTMQPSTYETWKNGTRFLKAIKPVKKEEANLWFDMLFKRKGGER